MARKMKNISQEEMADRLRMDKRSYQRIEYGEQRSLDMIMLFRIAKILDIDVFPLLKEIFNRS